jgi:hypothetical protein
MSLGTREVVIKTQLERSSKEESDEELISLPPFATNN